MGSAQGEGLPKQYESGQITPQQYFEGVRALTGANISESQFAEVSAEKFFLIPRTIQLMRQLRVGGIEKLALLSNTSEWDYNLGFLPVLRRANPSSWGDFDAVTLSYQVGVKKPDLRIWQDCLRKLNIPGRACVYLDDIQEYAKDATDLGMYGIQTILHENEEKGYREIVAKLEELGVQV